jgi:hypothetical protein
MGNKHRKDDDTPDQPPPAGGGAIIPFPVIVTEAIGTKLAA